MNGAAGPETEIKPLGAGEGGRLPRGLSLFRFVLFSALLLGACYGGASLYFGSPPPPGSAGAAAWSPSPLWLPSFLSIHAGLGVARMPEGLVRRGPLGGALFGGATILWGTLLGGAVGWVAGERIRRLTLRRG